MAAAFWRRLRRLRGSIASLALVLSTSWLYGQVQYRAGDPPATRYGPTGPPPRVSNQAPSPGRYPLPGRDDRVPMGPAVDRSGPDFGPFAGGSSPDSRSLDPSSSQAMRPLETRGNPDFVAPGNRFRPGERLAVVGDQYILAGDLYPMVNQYMEKLLGNLTAEQREQITPEQLDEQREVVLGKYLELTVEQKLLFVDFRRYAHKNARDKFQEMFTDIQKKVEQEFEKSQIDQLMSVMEVTNRAQLDGKLRSYGSSLEDRKRIFLEQALGQEMLKRSTQQLPEITYVDLRNRYQADIEKYQIPAKAKWEQLSVLFDQFPSRELAWNALAEMGNRVRFGASLAQVATQSSQEPAAPRGGFHDWTSQGSLVSDEIDASIFSLPLNALSPIIEDRVGYHIIRVLDRREAGFVPFAEAQEEIEKTLRDERKEKQRTEYLARLRREIPVWTVFDPPASDPRKGS